MPYQRVGNFSYLTSIEIPANVTSIGEGVFGRCSYLETMTVDSGNTVYDSRNNSNAIIKKSDNTLIAGCKETEIPDDVTSIGILAFYNCQSLTSVTIPASVTSIGEGAFEGSGLESITISANVTSIGNHAFEGCRNLGTMTVDGENTVYDSRNNCNAIIKTSTHTLIAGCKNTIIPNDVTSIGVSAFDGCENLTSVTIPANVTSIGDDAFMYCESLTSVTVYAPSCSLGTSAFYGCNNLTDIYVFSDLVDDYQGAENWRDYKDIITGITGGYCGADNETDVIWVLTGEYLCTLTISGTGAMANYAQPDANSDSRPWGGDYADDIKTIVIENGVTTIGNYAFYECFDLTTVTIPASVESIGNGAFLNCNRLTSVTIPANVTSIGDDAFGGTGLTSIEIPANVTSIGDYAFWYCSGLTSVTVYAPSCSLGGTSVFDGCDNLTDIYVFGKDVVFYKGATNWRAYADKISVIFDGTSTGTINIPNEVTVKGVTYNRTFTPGKASTVMLPFDYTCNGQEGGTFYKFVGVEKENDNWVATMKATGDDANNQGTLTRNTPYLFMPTATTMTFPNINGSVTLITEGGGNCETAESGSHWTFKGTYEYKEWKTDGANADEIGRAYGFAGVQKEGEGIEVGDFVKVKSGAKIRPMYCYLLWSDTPNAANARALMRGAAATDEELPQSITVRLVGSNGEVTGIGTLDTKTGEMTFDSEAWYTLDGVRLSGKPSKKGLYINNGKKVVIK